MLTREQIQSAVDLKSEVVSVPEWGGDVTVIVMDGRARDVFQTAMQAGDKSVSYFQSTLLVATVVGADAKPLFTADDIDWLRNKSSAALTRVGRIAERMNGFGAAAVEEAEKNSEAAPSGSSGSA
ncbi:hypothetical protein [Paraburkholderia domus]|uniref:hypothetical protein n=1 Tax=Paraburkholderia domus TaxID=2793075 RepID=UPI001914B055|nr:hypothetical protein [Paraburkholderia domus]MBK5058899.1 hypothetical protein [Burkholderia sp. R-70199]CAE6880000.1 hypothetical protein R70199_02469 [Paraburkholderia domus]